MREEARQDPPQEPGRATTNGELSKQARVVYDLLGGIRVFNPMS